MRTKIKEFLSKHAIGMCIGVGLLVLLLSMRSC